METSQTRKEELQGFIDSRKQQLTEGVSLSAQGVINSEITAFETEIAAINAQAEQEAAQQVRIQEQEVKVESEPIPIAVSGVDLTKLDPELIQLMELVTKADRRARNVDFNAEVETIQTDHKEQLSQASERESQWKQTCNELQTRLNTSEESMHKLQTENDELNIKYYQALEQVKDSDSKRDAAVKKSEDTQVALDQALQEVNRLQTVVEEYQRAKVFGEREAQKIIDITPEETNKAQNLVDSLAKKFVSATPIAANWHEVVDEHGNKTIVHTDELQKLEEVQPFRPSELDQAHVGSSPDIAAVTIQPVAEVTAPAVQFQGEVPMGPGLSSPNGSQTEAQTVTRYEFEALKADVEVLKRRQGMVA